jgi:hypothetical protein
MVKNSLISETIFNAFLRWQLTVAGSGTALTPKTFIGDGGGP